MAYDPTDPVQVGILKFEVTTNPIGIVDEDGTDLLAIGNDNLIAAVLNDAALNLGGETGRPPLTLGSLFKVIAVDSSTATQFEYVTNLLFAMAAQEGPQTDVSDFREAVIAVGDISVNAALNALIRPKSRPDVLFGVDDANGVAEFVLISGANVSAAKAS